MGKEGVAKNHARYQGNHGLRSLTYFLSYSGVGTSVMRQVSGEQLADFTANVEELC
jgi:hypothetical protein